MVNYKHPELNGGRSLMIDIGGFTTAWIAVNPSGEVEYDLARSVPLGIQNVVADFEASDRGLFDVHARLDASPG